MRRASPSHQRHSSGSTKPLRFSLVLCLVNKCSIADAAFDIGEDLVQRKGLALSFHWLSQFTIASLNRRIMTATYLRDATLVLLCHKIKPRTRGTQAEQR
jgi:hypothetical protein